VFDPIRDITPPAVESAEWSAPIDRFVYARLKEVGLSPAPEVDRRVWIRRVTYDRARQLSGLLHQRESVE
jgi:hypothetical protein